MVSPDSSSNPRENQAKAKALWMKGFRAQVNGRVEKAMDWYRESLGLFPTAEAHTFLGWAYSFHGNYQAAIEECLKAIATDPSFGNPYNDIGAYFIEQEKWEEAVPWLEKALQSERYEPRHYPHFNLGRVFAHLRKMEEAKEQFQKALEIQPDYPPALQALAQIQSRFN